MKTKSLFENYLNTIGFTSNGVLEKAIETCFRHNIKNEHVKIVEYSDSKSTILRAFHQFTPFVCDDGYDFYFIQKAKSKRKITIYSCQDKDYNEIGHIDLDTKIWTIQLTSKCVAVPV